MIMKSAAVGDLFSVGKVEMVRCLEREIDLRKRNYPRWVAANRMTQNKADREIRVMQAVLKVIEALPDA